MSERVNFYQQNQQFSLTRKPKDLCMLFVIAVCGTQSIKVLPCSLILLGIPLFSFFWPGYGMFFISHVLDMDHYCIPAISGYGSIAQPDPICGSTDGLNRQIQSLRSRREGSGSPNLGRSPWISYRKFKTALNIKREKKDKPQSTATGIVTC
jgi:hypothetical protein